MTDLLSIWREARGPEPELPLWDCGLGAHRWSYSSEAMRAHYAAAVTEDALARFAERIRAAERERCAKLCETLYGEEDYWGDGPYFAEAIRREP